MCLHGIYAGVTATDDEILMDCPACVAAEDRRIELADEARRDRAADADEARSARYDGIYDTTDEWF